MSLYATLFRWSRDPSVRGDAAAFIDAIDDYVFDPDTLPRRVLPGPGAPTILEASIGAFAHPVIDAFAPDAFLTALVAAIEPELFGPYRACDVRVDLDDEGRAAWIGVIIADAHRELLSVVGNVAAAHGLSGFDHHTGATVAHCAPKRWLFTGDEERVWDPAWADIERSLAAAPRDDHFKTLEHPSLALMQYMGTPERLVIEYVHAWGAAPAYARRDAATGAIEEVEVGYAKVRVDTSALLTLADARVIFEHYYVHANPHPGYRWRREKPGPVPGLCA